MAAPYQEPFGKLELGLWSILSTLNGMRNFVEQITASDYVHAMFPSCVDKTNFWSENIHKGKSWNLSTSKPLSVWECNKKVTYIPNVSWAELWCEVSEFSSW